MSIKLGDRVIDADGHRGVVVKIVQGRDQEDHGTVFVWQGV